MDTFGSFVRRAIAEEPSREEALARVMTRIRAVPSVSIGGRAFNFRTLPIAVAQDAIINATARNSEDREPVTDLLADSIFQAYDIEVATAFSALVEYLRAVDWMH